jgi:hypothetical protein
MGADIDVFYKKKVVEVVDVSRLGANFHRTSMSFSPFLAPNTQRKSAVIFGAIILGAIKPKAFDCLPHDLFLDEEFIADIRF